MSEPLRCLIDPPLDGPANMARDEALLDAVAAGDVPPALRFYHWDPPTISLGYFQKFADVKTLEPPARDLPIVRRLTGGGAILHADELTYSITVPTGHSLVRKNPNDLYSRFHDAVVAALETIGLKADRCGKTVETHSQQGPFFCFQRRHCFDLLVGEEKIAGSAQKRTANAVLQHGSIILDAPFAQQQSFGGLGCDDITLAKLVAEIQKALNLAIEQGQWSKEELAAADNLRAKYLDPAWTQRM